MRLSPSRIYVNEKGGELPHLSVCAIYVCPTTPTRAGNLGVVASS